MGVVEELVAAIKADTDGSLNRLGHSVGQIFTNHGLPIDMALSRIKASKTQKIAILNGALEEVMAHKRRSSAGEKAIARTRESNRRALERFVLTGESGIY